MGNPETNKEMYVSQERKGSQTCRDPDSLDGVSDGSVSRFGVLSNMRCLFVYRTLEINRKTNKQVPEVEKSRQTPSTFLTYLPSL